MYEINFHLQSSFSFGGYTIVDGVRMKMVIVCSFYEIPAICQCLPL